MDFLVKLGQWSAEPEKRHEVRRTPQSFALCVVVWHAADPAICACVPLCSALAISYRTHAS
jgi:hypothetical protein